MRVSTGVGRTAVTGHDQGVARRYARAILEVAREQGGTAPARTAHRARGARAPRRDETPAIRGLLLDRTLTPEARRKAAAAVGQAATLSPVTAKVVEMLAAHDRLALLPALAEAYAAAWNAAQGIVTAEAVSAAPLEPEQLRALSSALGDALGAKVDLRARVDPTVLGGVARERRWPDLRRHRARTALGPAPAPRRRQLAERQEGRGWRFAPKRSHGSSASSSAASPPRSTSPRPAPCSASGTASPASTASSAAWPASSSSCPTASWASP